MVVPDRRRFDVRGIPRAALGATLAAFVVLALLSGCSSKGPVYVDEGASYNADTALEALQKADASALATKATADGVKLRHDALAALRREGTNASAVADLLTRTFPSTTSGVPVYVERGTFNNTPAVIVVEATGPASGTLSSKRLWVLGENGDILFAGSR
jgi:hypothetical protein